MAARASVFLADFGLARPEDARSRYTRTGELLGTVAYMSPEQARGETALTPAADVWSLGCVLHELLAGRPPFDTGGVAADLGAVLTAEPPGLRRIRPDIPATLDTMVRAMLAKSAHRRVATAGAVRADLQRILDGARPHARPAATRGRLAALALGAAAAAVASLVTAWPRADRPSTPASPAAEDRVLARVAATRHVDPEGAQRLLLEAIAAGPARPEWWLELGLLRWARGDGVSARDAWAHVAADAPCAARARLYVGLEAFCRFEDAGLAFASAESLLAPLAATGGAIGRLADGACRIIARDWAGARTRLADLPDWEASLLRAYLEENDPGGDRAAVPQEYERALATGPEFVWARYNLGQTRHDLGDRAGAVREFDRVVALAPTFAQVYLSRSRARLESGDASGALADAEVSVRLAPDGWKGFHNRSVARVRLGDTAGAVADATRALELGADAPLVLFNRGHALALLGRGAEAERDYRAALRLDPDCVEARNNLGLLLRHSGRPAEAMTHFETLLQIRPSYSDAQRNRGLSRMDLGDLDGALADLDAVVGLRPDDARVRYERGLIRGRRGEATQAAEDYAESIRLDPTLAEPHGNLALWHAHEGRPSEAAAEAREFLRLAPLHARRAEFEALAAAGGAAPGR